MNSISSSLHSPLDARPSPPPSKDEVLVRVEGVSKKFCRSLKKSLWYGVCDIASELLPGRKHQRVAGSELRVAGEEAEVAGSELLVASEEGRVAGNESRVTRSASGPATRHQSPATASETPSPLVTAPTGASAPVTSYPPPVTSPTPEASLRPGEFFAVEDVSFELRRGECLGLIGHNGAGKTTLLKMLNGLIKPDAGSITMRGRVGALIALGAGFNPILTCREPEGWEALRKSNRRLARRVQRRREGANQNIYINGSVLGLTKKEPERWAARRTESLGWLKEEQPKVGPTGAASGAMQVNGCRRQARRAPRVGRTANQINAMMPSPLDSGPSTLPIYRHASAELFLGDDRALGLKKLIY